MRIGAPQIVDNKDLKLLNVDINCTRGLAEKNDTLVKNIDFLIKEVQSERGQHSCAKTPSALTTKLYQLLAYNNHVDIHLVNSEISKKKNLHHQMESTSV